MEDGLGWNQRPAQNVSMVTTSPNGRRFEVVCVLVRLSEAADFSLIFKINQFRSSQSAQWITRYLANGHCLQCGKDFNKGPMARVG